MIRLGPLTSIPHPFVCLSIPLSLPPSSGMSPAFPSTSTCNATLWKKPNRMWPALFKC